MSIADVKYFNFLVHFGPSNQYNLTELMEQCLLSCLGDEPVVTLPTSKSQQLRNIQCIEIDGNIYITGLMYKSGSLSWESIPDPNDDPTIDPGEQAIMPYARFILSPADHRLFWITKRGLSKSPTAIDFCNFIKRITLPVLRKNYKVQAELVWKDENPDFAERHRLPKAINLEKKIFIKAYLESFKLTMTLMEIRVVPETSTELAMQFIEDPNFIVTNAILHPHMNNVTDEECSDLFTSADKLAKDSNGEVTVNLKADDNKVGLKKGALENLLKINENLNLLKYKLKLKNKINKNAKPLILSNMELNLEEQKHSASASKSATTELDPKDISIVRNLIEGNPDMAARRGAPLELVELIYSQLKNTNE